jgi:hypothetical protein
VPPSHRDTELVTVNSGMHRYDRLARSVQHVDGRLGSLLTPGRKRELTISTGLGWPGRLFAEPPGPGGQVCHGKCERPHRRALLTKIFRDEGYEKGAQILLRAVRRTI